MDPHYNAFLKWLQTADVTQRELEEELAHYRTPISSFIRKLHNILDDNGTTYQLWASDYQFFSFGDSLLGRDFWNNVFPSGGLLKELLAPYYLKLLTNEDIFIKFLKHHRIYSKSATLFAASHEDPSDIDSPTYSAFQRMFVWPAHNKWSAINIKWQSLVNHFGLTGTVDYSKVFKGLLCNSAT